MEECNIKHYTVEESHGTALVQIDLQTFGDKNQWKMGIQIQNGTIKCNFLAVNYHNSTCQELPTMLDAINPEIPTTLLDLNYQKNTPRKKCYISFSKRLLGNNKNYHHYSFEELRAIFTTAYNEIITIYNNHSTTPLQLIGK
jgi:hypothetical protein